MTDSGAVVVVLGIVALSLLAIPLTFCVWPKWKDE